MLWIRWSLRMIPCSRSQSLLRGNACRHIQPPTNLSNVAPLVCVLPSVIPLNMSSKSVVVRTLTILTLSVSHLLWRPPSHPRIWKVVVPTVPEWFMYRSTVATHGLALLVPYAMPLIFLNISCLARQKIFYSRDQKSKLLAGLGFRETIFIAPAVVNFAALLKPNYYLFKIYLHGVSPPPHLRNPGSSKNTIFPWWTHATLCTEVSV